MDAPESTAKRTDLGELSDEGFWREHEAWVAGVKATDMSIIVKDPMTSGGFGRSYTSYKVFTKPHEWAVRRRFSDFVWLRDTLVHRYIGVLIPVLPEKKAFGSTASDVVKQRMRGLGLFLDALLDNPYIKRDKILEQFLNVQDASTFEDVKKSVAKVASNAGDDEAANPGEYWWRRAIARYTSPERVDRIINDVHGQLDAYDRALKALCQSSKELVDKSRAYAAELDTFALAYGELGRVQGELADSEGVEFRVRHSAELATFLQRTGRGVAAWGRIESFQPEILDCILHEVIRFEQGQVEALRDMIGERERMVKEVFKAQQQEQKATRDFEVGQNKALPAPKLEKLEAAKLAAEQAVMQREKVVEFMTKGLFFSELDRLNEVKMDLLRKLLGQLAAMNLRQQAKHEKLWKTMLGELKLEQAEQEASAERLMEVVGFAADSAGGGGQA